MSQAVPVTTRPPAEVVRQTPVSQAPNGICYAIAGEMIGLIVIARQLVTLWQTHKPSRFT